MAALFGLFVKEVGSPIISHWSVVNVEIRICFNKTRFGGSNVLFQKGYSLLSTYTLSYEEKVAILFKCEIS